MAEKLNKSPMKKINPPKSHSPVLNQHRTESPKRHSSQRSNSGSDNPQQFTVPRSIKQNPNLGVSKASNIPTPKGSPMKRAQQQQQFVTPELVHSQEQWIDGPRVSRSKVAEARHLLREINHVKNHETWIDGPKTASPPTVPTLLQGGLPNSGNSTSYGFMDSHKKSMIRQWVENQSSQLMLPNQTQITIQQQRQIITALQQGFSGSQVMAAVTSMTSMNSRSNVGLNDDLASVHSRSCEELVNPLLMRGLSNLQSGPASSESAIRTGLKQMVEQQSNTSVHDGLSDKSVGPAKEGQEEEDQDSGPSEVPPALPLIEPLGSREISHESLMEIVSRHMSRESLALSQQHVEVMDCGLQVTEEDILRTMGR